MALDQKITSDAAKISSQYSDLVSLATRQAMSTLDITAGTDSSGKLVPGDVKIFMKNVGTDLFVFPLTSRNLALTVICVHRRINPVEHIYAAFPMLLYLNASLGGGLLQPLLESQDSLTGQLFAAQDLGSAYPIASGSHPVSSQGVEREYPSSWAILLAE